MAVLVTVGLAGLIAGRLTVVVAGLLAPLRRRGDGQSLLLREPLLLRLQGVLGLLCVEALVVGRLLGDPGVDLPVRRPGAHAVEEAGRRAPGQQEHNTEDAARGAQPATAGA